MSGREKFVLKYEMSALKMGELFALSNTTDTATLTIICEMCDVAQAFSYRVLSEFQSALSVSSSMCCDYTRRRSQVVRNRIVALECAIQHWMAIYIDTSCVRIFGMGSFVSYFLDSNLNELKFGGFAAGKQYDVEIPLINNHSFTLLVSSLDGENKILPLIEASRQLQASTDILTYAFARWVVQEKKFCVIAMTASRVLAETQLSRYSPRKSLLNVLDSDQNFLRTRRHEICQSSEEVDIQM